jgi:DNA polymerase
MLTARQQHCLKGIGIQAWSKRKAIHGGGSANESVPVVLADDEIEALNQFIETARPAATPEALVTATPEETGDRPRLSNDESVKIDAEPEKPGRSPVPDTELSPTPVSTEARPDTVVEVRKPPVLDSWDAIIEAIQACDACELAQNCTRKVPGVGDRQADLLIVGEGPGHDEDIQGEPFVGRSGQLLDRMLAAIGIARDQVYITNIVKCRPPNNRDPKQDEAALCRAYLEAQIRQVSPKVILSVGRVSAHNLLGSNQPVGKLITQMHTLPGTDIPVKVTYHPAYLLRNPSAKSIAWQDLKLLHQMLQ